MALAYSQIEAGDALLSINEVVLRAGIRRLRYPAS